MAKYYYVRGRYGTLKRILIAEEDIVLDGVLMEFYPRNMKRIDRSLMYCKDVSSIATDDHFWDELESRYRKCGRSGKSQDWLLLRYEFTSFRTHSFELVMVVSV